MQRRALASHLKAKKQNGEEDISEFEEMDVKGMFTQLMREIRGIKDSVSFVNAMAQEAKQTATETNMAVAMEMCRMKDDMSEVKPAMRKLAALEAEIGKMKEETRTQNRPPRASEASGTSLSPGADAMEELVWPSVSELHAAPHVPPLPFCQVVAPARAAASPMLLTYQRQEEHAVSPVQAATFRAASPLEWRLPDGIQTSCSPSPARTSRHQGAADAAMAVTVESQQQQPQRQQQDMHLPQSHFLESPPLPFGMRQEAEVAPAARRVPLEATQVAVAREANPAWPWMPPPTPRSPTPPHAMSMHAGYSPRFETL